VKRVRGEQPLPGATESLLRAVGGGKGPTHRNVARYLGLSVQAADDGRYTVMVVRLDRASGRVVPEVLDTFYYTAEQPPSLTEVLRYWAGDDALDRIASSL